MMVGWVLEWGAVTLPEGHPSRITCMSIHKTREEAVAAQKDCDFDSRVFAAYTRPEALTEERIDRIADLVVKGMPDGLRGFCKVWGWQQFARALLEVCEREGVPDPSLAADVSHTAGADGQKP